MKCRSLHRAIVLILFFTSGCAQTYRDRSLQGVAKEWSKTIRASQVIPVYPLTQDIQVGDVYVVDYPIESEQLLWNSEGYLPLPQQLCRIRLTPQDFAAQYPAGVHGTPNTDPPALMLPPQVFENDITTASTSAPTSAPAVTSNLPLEQRRKLQHWTLAPQGFFPPYSVNVSLDTGLDIGLPISGIPVAVGLLNSQTANASVTLSEAYTYGLDNDTMLKAFERLRKENPHFLETLKNYSPIVVRDENGSFQMRYRFLRIITRVYLIGGANVTVTDTTDTGTKVRVGLESNFKLFDNMNSKVAGYKQFIDAINAPTSRPYKDDAATTADTGVGPTTNESGEAKKPDKSSPSTQPLLGGDFKFGIASDRSITMNQSFEKPLVVGYVAFDLPIGAESTVGSRPIDTYRKLTTDDIRHTADITAWLIHDPQAEAILDAWVAANTNWFRTVGLDQFACHPDELKKYFTMHWVQRFIKRHSSGHSTSWSALNDRIGQECVGMPQGLLSAFGEATPSPQIVSHPAPSTLPVNESLQRQFKHN